MASCAKCGKNPGVQGAIGAADAAMVVGPAALLGMFGAGALCCSNPACGKVFCDGCANGFVKKSCPSCGNNLSSGAPSGGGGGISSQDLEGQTDRVVDAIGETTEAVRETTAAVKVQTAVIAAGFAATVSELKSQTGLLGNINDTMSAAVGELQGIREDMYATTKNREALEANSKLERASQLLGSDLPGDALKLIGEAQELNPADFSVWYAKTHICQKAIQDGGDFMSEEDARSEGSAALERAVKLFPKHLIGEQRGLTVSKSLAAASLVIGSEESFLSAVNLYISCLLSGGAIDFCPPAADMTRLLDSARQTPSGDAVAGTSIGLVARAASGCEETQLGAVAREWATLEALRGGIGSEVASALASRIGTVAGQIASATTEAVGGVSDEWPSKLGLRGMITKIKSSAGSDVATLGQISSAIAGGPDNYAELQSAQERANKISTEFQPDAWLKEIGGLVEPSRLEHKAIAGGAVAWLAFWLFVCVYWIVDGQFGTGELFFVLFFTVPGIAAGYVLGLRHVLAERNCTSDQRTRMLVDRISALADGWSA